MIRDFMRVTFPEALDILFVFSIIGVVIAAFTAGSTMLQYSDGSFLFIPFLSVLLTGIIGVVVAFGVIYALLDIRDALQDKKQE